MSLDLQRLTDAQGSIARIIRHLDGAPASAALDDGRLLDAILYQVALIGEALHWVSGEAKGLAPDIPWRPIRKMRNLIVHRYWRVDAAIVIGVVEKDLGPIQGALDRLARQLQASDA